MSAPVFESNLRSVKLLNRGKIRDIYAIDDEHLLFVASDRLSAFDVVLPDPIPGKGRVLTDLSLFWFARTAQLVRNHLATDVALEDVLSGAELDSVRGQALVVKRLAPLPVEAIVRGYLIGSGWKDYRKTGAVCGIPLPKGLALAQQLPEPIFTPADKAPVGQHDENIPFAEVERRLGAPLARQLRDVALRLYREAAAFARDRGIIIADTKFEFGVDESGRLHLIDEVLTPDSSRFWPADTYRVGVSPPSFDKQFVRDYLETLDWDKKAPGPVLPDDIVAKTAAKYREAQRRLTGV